MQVRLNTPEELDKYRRDTALPLIVAFLVGIFTIFALLTLGNIVNHEVPGKIFVGCLPIACSLLGLARCLPIYLRLNRRGYTVIFQRSPDGQSFQPLEVTDEDLRKVHFPFDGKMRMCISTVRHRPSYFLEPCVTDEGHYWRPRVFQAWISTDYNFFRGTMPMIGIRCSNDTVLDPVAADDVFAIGWTISDLVPGKILLQYRQGGEALERLATLEDRYDIDVSDRNVKIEALRRRVAQLLVQREAWSERFYGAITLLIIVLDFLKDRSKVPSRGPAGKLRHRIAQHMQMLYTSRPEKYAEHIEREVNDTTGRQRENPAQIENWFGYIAQRWWTKCDHQPAPHGSDSSEAQEIDRVAWAATQSKPTWVEVAKSQLAS